MQLTETGMHDKYWGALRPSLDVFKSTMTTVRAQLDHIVILVPHDLLASPPSWLTNNFTISPGGVHADGRTENRLILFSDGVYIELIAFTPGTSQADRESHGWGKKPYGIVDYAFTLPPDNLDEVFESLRQQWRSTGVGEELIAAEPVQGGRTRPDGEVLKWKVATVGQEERGVANFWCFDVTPRHLRVPLSKEGTTHPSSSSGIASVQLDVHDESTLRELGKLFGAYLDGPKKGGREFGISTPVKHAEGEGPKIRLGQAGAPQKQKAEIKIGFSSGGDGERKTVKGDIDGRTVVFEFV
jgi:hypothetical protein